MRTGTRLDPGGGTMRYRLAWPLAGVACLAVLVGVAVLWHWEHTAVGVSVGVPVAATLLAPLISWAFSAQQGAGRPTAEQSESARQASGRLIVLGAAGSGKTTLARLLVAELLKQAQPGDQVPVLLPVSAWNPDREGL